MNYIYGIILAGGTGSRMKSSVPKQFLKLRGEELIRHSVRTFQNWGLCKHLVIVANEAYIEQTEEVLADLLSERDRIVVGGATRHESTLCGIGAITLDKNDILIFHDAARPFIKESELNSIADSVLKSGASSFASGVNETIVSVHESKVDKILDRENIQLIKTPQGFHSSLLHLLLKEKMYIEPTDICSWVLNIGVKSELIESNPFNIKITKEGDIELAEKYWELFKKL
jgi:2-C-methyl-D-erythritol 4-phosphate cytidylyltransferase